MKAVRNIKISKILAGAFVGLAAIFAVAVAPVDKVLAANCQGTETYFDWGCGSSGSPIMNVLVTIYNWMSIGVTIAVVGGIIYGATLYSSAGGKSDQAKKGMGIIRGAVIALVLYFALFAILNFILPGGFTSP